MGLGDVVTAAACVLAVASARPAHAADAAPPTITHTPPGMCPPSSVVGASPPPCVIEATIVDDSGVFDPTLLVRLRGVQAFDRVPMKPVAGRADIFSATVPAALVTAGGVEYLIEAFDLQGNGPARAGDEHAPLVLLAPAVAQVPVPPPVEDNTGVIIGVAVGVAAAVVVGVGVGFAVYALRPPALDQVTVTVTAPSPIGAALGAR